MKGIERQHRKARELQGCSDCRDAEPAALTKVKDELPEDESEGEDEYLAVKEESKSSSPDRSIEPRIDRGTTNLGGQVGEYLEMHTMMRSTQGKPSAAPHTRALHDEEAERDAVPLPAEGDVITNTSATSRLTPPSKQIEGTLRHT